MARWMGLYQTKYLCAFTLQLCDTRESVQQCTTYVLDVPAVKIVVNNAHPGASGVRRLLALFNARKCEHPTIAQIQVRTFAVCVL